VVRLDDVQMELTMSRVRTLPTVFAAAALAAGMSAAPALAASAQPTSLTLKAAKSSVVHNQKTTLTGTLKAGTKPLSAQPVILEKRAAGAKAWSVVSSKNTSSKGTVSYVVTPGTKKGQKEQYYLVFKGNAKYKASHSAVITITVT
jgi:hypothetical protein